MKIIIKTLQGKQLPLEVEETDAVSLSDPRLMILLDWSSEAKDPG